MTQSSTKQEDPHDQDRDRDHDLIWAFQDTVKAENRRGDHAHDYVHLHVRPEGWKRSKYGKIYTIDLEGSEDLKQIKPRCQCRSGESSSRYVYNLGFLKFKRQKLDGSTSSSSKKDILCLHRHKVWWMRPTFCSVNRDEMNIPPETIFLLGLGGCTDDGDNNLCEEGILKNDQVYRLIIPLILPDKNGYTSCSLKSSSTNTDEIELHSDTGGKVALYCGRSTNPFKLIQDGVMASSVAQDYHTDPDENKHCTEIEAGDFSSQLHHPLLSSNALPPFANKLGWCTWNAFYTQLNGEKIISAVRSLWAKGIPVKWMIIDDGWQHTTNDDSLDGMQWGERLLNVNGPSPQKFSSEERIHEASSSPPSVIKPSRLLSLKETISQLKYPKDIEIGLDAVLAWHTMSGYWLGLSNDEENDNYQGPDTTLYYPHFSTNIIDNDFSITKEQSILKGIGIANNVTMFYEQYHSFLDRSGFDGVKIDAQGVHGFLRPYSTFGGEGSQINQTQPHRHQISVQQQDALASSITKRFSSAKSSVECTKASNNKISNPVPPNNIMCMCHSPEIIYRLPNLYSNTKPLIRASDDFYPENDFCHGPHIVSCAFNSLLLGNLASPDWDMFFTDLSMTGELHAMARAISGGPVYFSDNPSSINPDIIERLVCKNGVVLLCSDHARPTRSSLFTDPLDKDGCPMILWNINGRIDNRVGNDTWPTSGILAIFNLGGSTWCYEKLNFIEVAGAVRTSKNVIVSPLDVEPFRQKRYENHQFVAVSSREGILKAVLSRNDSFKVKVSHLQAHIVHILPIHQTFHVDFVVIGITKLYNFAGAISQVRMQFYQTDKEERFEGDGILGLLDEQLKVSIDVIGCGQFFVAYKFKNSSEVSAIHTYLDGVSIEHFIIDPNAANHMFLSEEEKLLSSFLQHGFHLDCIHLPCQDRTDTAELEIVVG